MIELKPCPFCGGEARLHSSFEWSYVSCEKCNATASMRTSEKQAIEVWNNRPSPWHTGIPTEEGWFLVKYRWTGGEGFPNKFTYRAVKNQRLRNGTILFTELEPSSEYWEPIKYQKLDDKEASE